MAGFRISLIAGLLLLLSCSSAPAKKGVGQPCTQDSECQSGLSCIHNICMESQHTACLTTAQCPQGYVCRDSVCVPQTSTQSEGSVTQCVYDSDCPANLRCINGQCIAQNSTDRYPADCIDSSDWQESSNCDSDNCQEKSCNSDSDCPQGFYCDTESGICKPQSECSNDQECDDANPCTEDKCQSGECTHIPLSAVPCDDNNACTVNDICKDGVCSGIELECDDDNPCTQDLCLPDTGCVYQPAEGECDDGNLCTEGDHCQDGICVPGQYISCDDGNVCTADTCIPDQGCVHTPQTGPCDDQNPCTQDDYCLNGECQPGVQISCDDQNPCTNDLCDPQIGCVHTPKSGPCDDGNICTVGDVCQGGQCIGLQQLQCDDQNPCTNDLCDPQQGCIYVPNQLPCDDGDPCTLGDKCSGGVCTPGAPLDCNDQNPCTKDYCLNGFCQHTPISGPCDDQNPCTINDTCQNGFCIGQPKECDDNNTCTLDSCQDGQCVHTPVSMCCGNGIVEQNEECDDGNQIDGDGCSSDCTSEYQPTQDPCPPPSVAHLGLCWVPGQNCSQSHEQACQALNLKPTPDSISCNWSKSAAQTIAQKLGNTLYEGCCASTMFCNDTKCRVDGYTDPYYNWDGCIDGLPPLFTCYQPECGDGKVEGLEECDDGNLLDGDGCSHDCKIELPCPWPSVEAGGYCWVPALDCTETHEHACQRIGKLPTPQELFCNWSQQLAEEIAQKLGNSIYKGCCANTMFCNDVKCRVDGYSDPFINWNGCVDELPPLYSCYK